MRDTLHLSVRTAWVYILRKPLHVGAQVWDDRRQIGSQAIKKGTDGRPIVVRNGTSEVRRQCLR